MKKIILTGMLGLCVALSSCSLDNDDDNNYFTNNYRCANLVIPSTGNTTMQDASYSLTIYPLSSTLNVTTSDLVINGTKYVFATNAMEAKTSLFSYEGNNYDITYFSGGTAAASGLDVTNLQGFLSSKFNILGTNDPANPAYVFRPFTPLVMSYTVNGSNTVKTFAPDAIYTGVTSITTVGSTDAPFTNDGIRYRVIFKEDYSKADVILYNANFASNMPVTINCILEDLTVAVNKDGYSIMGSNIVPSLYDETGLTPAPGFPFASFQLDNNSSDLSTAAIQYTVQIGPARYDGTFTGKYVFTDK